LLVKGAEFLVFIILNVLAVFLFKEVSALNSTDKLAELCEVAWVSIQVLTKAVAVPKRSPVVFEMFKTGSTCSNGVGYGKVPRQDLFFFIALILFDVSKIVVSLTLHA
jgi:hypothetical protein